MPWPAEKYEHDPIEPELRRSKPLWIVSALLLVNVLPYLSRLPRGIHWVSQYFPDGTGIWDTVLGFLFFHAFHSIAAIPVIIRLRRNEVSTIPRIATLVIVSILTWLFHADYDLSADAQAAIALIIFPFVSAAAGFGVLVFGELVVKFRYGRHLIIWATFIALVTVIFFVQRSSNERDELQQIVERLSAANNENMWGFLKTSPYRNNRFALAAIAQNPAASSETLRRIIMLDDPELLKGFYGKQQRELSGSGQSVIGLVSRHPNLTPDLLEQLAKNPSPWVLRGVARHNVTPAQSIEYIYNHRLIVSENYKQHTTASVERMIDIIEEAIATNPQTPVEILHELVANTRSAYTLTNLEKNLAAPAEVRERAATRIKEQDYHVWQRKHMKQKKTRSGSQCYLDYKNKQYEDALKSCQEEANLGKPHAQYNLAHLYRTGNGGIMNKAKAVENYQLAADQNYGEAQFSLGIMFSRVRV